MLTITRTDLDHIVADAHSRLPAEACGLIAGSIIEGGAQVQKIYPLANLDASASHFSLSPEDQFDVISDIRKNGFTLLGNYHSHTKTAPFPSPEDIRLAYDHDAYYLILSLEFDTPELKAFRLDKDIMVEVPLEIAP